MGMPPPEMAKIETIMFRHIKTFHEKFIDRLSSSAKDTLRCVAWQLDGFIEENKQYKDIEYLRTMLSIIEWVIQKKYGTNWTVERAKKDLRGRTRGVNQYKRKGTKKMVPISQDLKKAIESQVLSVKQQG